MKKLMLHQTCRNNLTKRLSSTRNQDKAPVIMEQAMITSPNKSKQIPLLDSWYFNKLAVIGHLYRDCDDVTSWDCRPGQVQFDQINNIAPIITYHVSSILLTMSANMSFFSISPEISLLSLPLWYSVLTSIKNKGCCLENKQKQKKYYL